MLKKIRKLAKEEYEEYDWKYHITPVVKYSLKLAEIYKADKKIVEIAALLHDIARAKYGGKDHDVRGETEAEKILNSLGAPEDLIKSVKHCIRAHRAKDMMPETIEAQIIANADAVSHFDIIPLWFYYRSKEMDFEASFKWVEDKIRRDYEVKITLPEARKMVEGKYKAILVVLEANKEYI